MEAFFSAKLLYAYIVVNNVTRLEPTTVHNKRYVTMADISEKKMLPDIKRIIYRTRYT